MRRTKEVARLTDALKRYISILLQLSVVINYARYAWIEFMHYSLDRVQRGLYRTLLLKRIVCTDISVSWHKFICLKFLNKCSKIGYSWDVYSSRPISLLMKKIIWIFFSYKLQYFYAWLYAFKSSSEKAPQKILNKLVRRSSLTLEIKSIKKYYNIKLGIRFMYI